MKEARLYTDRQDYLDNFTMSSLQGADEEIVMNAIFDHMWQPLFKIAYHLLKDDDEAKDIVQNVFIKLWNKRYELVLTSSLQAYLTTAVRYSSLTRLSKLLSENQRNIPLENYIEHSFNEAVDPLTLKEVEQEIDQRIRQLPGRMQEVLFLKMKEDLSISEIAVRLRISEDTVKNHLAAARKRLRVQLSDICYLALLISIF